MVPAQVPGRAAVPGLVTEETRGFTTWLSPGAGQRCIRDECLQGSGYRGAAASELSVQIRGHAIRQVQLLSTLFYLGQPTGCWRGCRLDDKGNKHPAV